MYYSRMVTLCLLFQCELDKCVNAIPRTVIYVDGSDEGVPTLYEQPLSSLADLIGQTALINKNSKKEKINERIFDEKHLSQGKAAYQGVWNRLNAFRGIQKYNLLMWKKNEKWLLANIQSFGDIGEAYVNFIYSRHGKKRDYLCRVPTGQSPYYSHYLIGNFFNHYIAKVDNASPVRGEDVVVKRGKDSFGFQAAVKAEGASTFGFEDYLKVAKYISENPLSTITKEDIETLTSNPVVRNKVRIRLEESTRQGLEDSLGKTSSKA